MIFVIAFSLFAIVASVNAGPRGRKDLTTVATHRDDGDARIDFNVVCTSTTWAVVIASDSIRRSILMQRGLNNTRGVCLSTATGTASICDDTTKGVEFSTVPAIVSLTSYDRGAWNCRARAGNDAYTGRIHGTSFRDSGDYGWIGD